MNTLGQTQFSAQQRTFQSIFKVPAPWGLPSIPVGGIDDPQLCLSANEPDYATCSSTARHSLIAPRTEPGSHVAFYGPSSPLPSSFPAPTPPARLTHIDPFSVLESKSFLPPFILLRLKMLTPDRDPCPPQVPLGLRVPSIHIPHYSPTFIHYIACQHLYTTV